MISYQMMMRNLANILCIYDLLRCGTTVPMAIATTGISRRTFFRSLHYLRHELGAPVFYEKKTKRIKCCATWDIWSALRKKLQSQPAKIK